MAEQIEKFDDTPAGQARRWAVEFAAARERLSKWHEQAEKVNARYLDERESGKEGESRLNLFTSNVQTQEAMLYGKIPAVESKRRYADSGDDAARVGAEMLGRLLNADIERDDDSFAEALGLALQDWRILGLGNVRLRYVAEFEPVPEVPAQMDPETGAELAPAVPATERKTSESVESRYVHWKDQLWSPCRVFGEMRWWAEKAYMTRADLEERFGSEIGSRVPLNAKSERDGEDEKRNDPRDRAEVWEIWDKEKKQVVWYCEGHPEVLDTKDDPLGLDRFFPFPKPLVANVTTKKFVPRPDFVLAQDLYNEIDTLSTRINLLEEALKVSGIYDKTCNGVKDLLSRESGNRLIPVDNWAALAEKGGLKGAIEWLPIEQIASVLNVLEAKRQEKIQLLFQVTGMSDIMRGQASSSATATEQSIKAKFGSVRIQRLQDEFARFASDLQRLKAEIISKHFEPQTIIERSNVLNTPDAQLAQQAAEVIKTDFPSFRIEVKPESISLTDYAALRQERTELIAALGGFFQAMMPAIQSMGPGALPFVLELAKWVVSGLKGSSSVEGVLDQAIAAAQQAASQPKPPPPPDPKLEAAKVKGEIDIAKAKMGMQATQMQTQAHVVKAQADIAKTKAQTEAAAMGGHMWGRNAALVPAIPGEEGQP